MEWRGGGVETNLSTTDVLIRGAGPAGCAAAIHARRGGLSVRLLELAAAPRRAPGETLHPGIEPLLAQLGGLQAVAAERFGRQGGGGIEWDVVRRLEGYRGVTLG